MVLETDFQKALVVYNLPVAGADKYDKLKGVMLRIFSGVGVIREDCFDMPLNSLTQQTLIYCFIQYSTPQEAELAKKNGNGFLMSKEHISSVKLFHDFERCMNVLGERTPEFKPYGCGAIASISFL